MKEIEFSQWLFELPAKQHSQFSPSGSTFSPCLSLPSKSHCENSISSIFLESTHQVEMKNVVKHFFGYFNTLETHSDVALLKRPINTQFKLYEYNVDQPGLNPLPVRLLVGSYFYFPRPVFFLTAQPPFYNRTLKVF